MATNNQNLSVRQYQPQYKGILNAVFEATKAFSGVTASLQILDGVQHNTKAFSVKTSATPVVVGTYSTDANTAFGTGTANSSRFGELKEVIYTDTDVEYDYTLAIHEGIDRHTVNTDLNSAVLVDSPISINSIAKAIGGSQGSLSEVRKGVRNIENLQFKTLVKLQEWADENFKESWDCEDLLNDLKEDIEDGINYSKVLTVREYQPFFNKYLPVDYYYLDEVDQIVIRDGELITLDYIDKLVNELETLNAVI